MENDREYSKSEVLLIQQCIASLLVLGIEFSSCPNHSGRFTGCNDDTNTSCNDDTNTGCKACWIAQTAEYGEGLATECLGRLFELDITPKYCPSAYSFFEAAHVGCASGENCSHCWLEAIERTLEAM